MMDYLASMYIDNELNLHEKIAFVKKIRSEQEFFQDTVALLEQERLLRIQLERIAVPGERGVYPDLKNLIGKIFKPLICAGSGFALAALLLFNPVTNPTEQSFTKKRFVLYEPAARRVELTGTFNGWQRVQMNQVGTTGYWELVIPMSAGEHRFAFILDGSRRMTDPTQPYREKDDFGGENSVLNVNI